jgi:membrane protein implicated in regulation of membrane protease activity
MAKLFAVTILIIAILSAIPIIRNTWHPMEDISTHGQAIDDQLSETMWEAGISFLASQIILAWFIWRFSRTKLGEKTKSFPGGAAGLVAAAFILCRSGSICSGNFGSGAV